MNESYQNWQPMQTLPENGWVELMTFSGNSELFLLEHKKPYKIYALEYSEYYSDQINEGWFYAWRSANPMNLDVVRHLLIEKLEQRDEAQLLHNKEREKRIALEKTNKELRAQIKELKSKEGSK
jgi:hypothetical protein